jgi:phosphatidylglycerol:prolipoprotein diacylglycerol transferase
MAAPLITFSGNFGIHGYGVAIATGVLIALWWASRHPWCRFFGSSERFVDFVISCVFVGILGGRLLYALTQWDTFEHVTDVFRIWEGGFSVWGTVIAIIIFLPFYAARHKLPVLLALDLCALYALLVHAIARLGCWYAGCCGGISTGLPWGLRNHEGVLSHPTQLYSAGILFLFFIILKRYLSRRYHRPGNILAWYMIGIALERGIVDFWREDRLMTLWSSMYSVHQLIALGMFVVGVATLIISYRLNCKPYEYL